MPHISRILTILAAKWDPIFKQPMLKKGAICITKPPSTYGEVKIHAHELQSAAIKSASKKHTKTQGTKTIRERGLKAWLGELDYAIDRLLVIFKGLILRPIAILMNGTGYVSWSVPQDVRPSASNPWQRITMKTAIVDRSTRTPWRICCSSTMTVSMGRTRCSKQFRGCTCILRTSEVA
ncbi:uncharacterized protein M421DRAFT_307712 [Didymella exigua CBS 183.55]|uniref:Uncharacterized protein n=1 Tax=Didymella exigua CBS 183.55 TaxID=1150837 RepID=A0A6A5RDA5_9PLEO|nr:uncharacterized protein M421DRAFT_307712 [Didymella exigua CBS 183.55]KAF1923687.1 hypothetical protein M421DRAFT_307712 [Didymella exigua CBS 183.55]